MIELGQMFRSGDGQRYRMSSREPAVYNGRRKGLQYMYQVTKRDGKIAEFNLVKISEAIRKAFEAQEKNYNQDIIDMLALKVTADFEPKIKEQLVSVEDIQDSVESVLIRAGYDDVAKGYILYRKQREKIRNLNSTLLDYKELVDS